MGETHLEQELGDDLPGSTVVAHLAEYRSDGASRRHFAHHVCLGASDYKLKIKQMSMLDGGLCGSWARRLLCVRRVEVSQRGD